MLRKNLIAVALLAASTGAMAGYDDHIYGRVVSVEPHFVFSIGSGGHHDGFRVLYEAGGRHYWTHSHHRPGHTIWVPRPVGHVIHHYKRPQRQQHWDGRRDDRWNDHRPWERHDRDGHRGPHDRY